MTPGEALYDEEEEDFFTMLSKEEQVVPQLISMTNASATQEQRQNVPTSPEPVHHLLASESDHEIPAVSTDAHIRHADEMFEEVLTEFYSKYNFGNLEKVAYLAEKFNFRRWELWEQLSIKYRLSPNESRKLWIRFNVSHDGINECARKLFQSDEVVSIPDDAVSLRKISWRRLLRIVPDDTQRDLYRKYASELAPGEVISKLSPENNDIARDVHRTHQELALFQEESTKLSLIEVLTVYTKLNGLSYVQGMNEVLGIVFFVMRDESDSFWAFSSIMDQLKDLFTAEADSTRDGIYYRVDMLSDLLRQYDYKVARYFNDIDFPLATLAMRWMTTLLVMDLNLPDAMRLWDVVLQSCSPGQLLTFSTCLSLGYLLGLSERLLSSSLVEDAVETCAHFGKSADVDVERILVDSLSIFAFESILRGRYTPSSDEPVLDAIVDAVGTMRSKLVQVVTSDEVQKRKEDLAVRVSSAKSLVSGWIGNLVASIPSSNAQSRDGIVLDEAPVDASPEEQVHPENLMTDGSNATAL